MTIDITAESKQRDNGRWFASVEWREPSGESRRFESPDVDSEAEADALCYGAAQDVVKQIQAMDSTAKVIHEEWNGAPVGKA